MKLMVAAAKCGTGSGGVFRVSGVQVLVYCLVGVYEYCIHHGSLLVLLEVHI